MFCLLITQTEGRYCRLKTKTERVKVAGEASSSKESVRSADFRTLRPLWHTVLSLEGRLKETSPIQAVHLPRSPGEENL